jgi:copper(I)-binding protein
MKALMLALLLAFACPANAHEIKVGDLRYCTSHGRWGWKGQVSAKGSVKIRNDGKTSDQLLSINAEFAEKTVIDAPVPVPIPANGQAISIPIIYEVIKRKLSEDEAYAGEFVFENAGTVQMDLMVHTHAH